MHRLSMKVTALMPNLFKEPGYVFMRWLIKHVICKTKSYRRLRYDEKWSPYPPLPVPGKRRYLGIKKKNEKTKRVLYVYHQNFLRDNSGANSYVLQIIKRLKKLDYSIDCLATTVCGDDFSDFYDYNATTGNLVDNFYLRDSKIQKYEKIMRSQCSYVDDALVEYFQDLIDKNEYQAIYVHSTGLMELLRNSNIGSHTKIIGVMDEFNSIHSFNWHIKDDAEKFALLGSFLSEEIEILGYCDDVMCISADEKRLMEKFHPDVKFHYLPYFLESKTLSVKEKDIDCLFTGHCNPYNVDSLCWLIEYVLPLLESKVRFVVCGEVCQLLQKEKRELYSRGMEYGMEMLGYVEDLDEIHARSRISLVPTLAGAGLKIKCINSMARGIPCIVTDLGVDGFLDKTENGCVIANTPMEFANSIMKLLDDQLFYDNAVEKTKVYFERHFSLARNECILSSVLSV